MAPQLYVTYSLGEVLQEQCVLCGDCYVQRDRLEHYAVCGERDFAGWDSGSEGQTAVVLR